MPQKEKQQPLPMPASASDRLTVWVSTAPLATPASPPPRTPVGYSPRALAALINVDIDPDGTTKTLSERTIRKWCERGHLPARKVCGRWIISRKALDKLLSPDKGGLSW